MPFLVPGSLLPESVSRERTPPELSLHPPGGLTSSSSVQEKLGQDSGPEEAVLLHPRTHSQRPVTWRSWGSGVQGPRPSPGCSQTRSQGSGAFLRQNQGMQQPRPHTPGGRSLAESNLRMVGRMPLPSTDFS